VVRHPSLEVAGEVELEAGHLPHERNGDGEAQLDRRRPVRDSERRRRRKEIDHRLQPLSPTELHSPIHLRYDVGWSLRVTGRRFFPLAGFSGRSPRVVASFGSVASPALAVVKSVESS
jgi:hypothetical protein